MSSHVPLKTCLGGAELARREEKRQFFGILTQHIKKRKKTEHRRRRRRAAARSGAQRRRRRLCRGADGSTKFKSALLHLALTAALELANSGVPVATGWQGRGGADAASELATLRHQLVRSKS